MGRRPVRENAETSDPEPLRLRWREGNREVSPTNNERGTLEERNLKCGSEGERAQEARSSGEQRDPVGVKNSGPQREAALRAAQDVGAPA